jgi:parallel beta-helix repeat protein
MKRVFKVFPNLLLMSLISLASAKDESRIQISKDTVFSNDIEIPFGSTIVISPGVKIQFDGYRTIIIKGLIIAQGTGDAPILFTSIDRVRGSREKPGWKGFEIAGKDAQGLFLHCRFEGAFRNLVWGSAPSFDSCEFAGNHYALYCTNKAMPNIKNCKFYRNTYGVASDYASPLMNGNTITENNIGLYLQLSSSALAGKNIISENEVNIRSEDAFGSNNSSLSMQHLWELMLQLY